MPELDTSIKQKGILDDPYLYPGLVKEKQVAKSLNRAKVPLNIISLIVCNHFNTTISIVSQKCKKREIVEVRQIIHHFALKYNVGSLTFIGECIGQKDHATVLHSDRVVKNLYETDRRYAEDIDKIELKIKIYAQEVLNC